MRKFVYELRCYMSEILISWALYIEPADYKNSFIELIIEAKKSK